MDGILKKYIFFNKSVIFVNRVKLPISLFSVRFHIFSPSLRHTFTFVVLYSNLISLLFKGAVTIAIACIIEQPTEVRHGGGWMIES